ncbi:hypothetical protein CGRA01v4_07578 [Colletotrichum graminicola]|nr:hypothetical protein CGRA01v4_07578 [Colletotrichum graminicola]
MSLTLSFAADTNFLPAAGAHRHSRIAQPQPNPAVPVSATQNGRAAYSFLPLQPSTIHTRHSDAETTDSTRADSPQIAISHTFHPLQPPNP